jgi:S-adenosylmethionine:tRNA ribosyltransferase-isomerase
MKLGQFKYELPKELIAQHPLPHRDDAKLMVLDRKTGKIEHKKLLDYFSEGDVMVNNNTKVFPARMYGNKEKTGSMIEVFLLRELNDKSLLWDTVVDPARKIRIGNKLYFGPNDELVAEVIDNTTSRGRTLRFLYDGPHEDFKKLVYSLGETPLPKYIERPVEPEVAAPTAGLHFSKQLSKRLEIAGINMAELTLHIGLGTFRTVEVEDLTKHKTDSEQLIIPEVTADLVNDARAKGKRVCAVGTTTLRAFESSVGTNNTLKAFDGWASKFIFPPYDFQIADSLITNFHEPQSVLLMMTTAFGGYDLVMEAYKEAIKKKYRFFCYGDAMLII